MIYNIAITAEQAHALGNWVATGENLATVELRADEHPGQPGHIVLVARQGDDYMAWLNDGTEADSLALASPPESKLKAQAKEAATCSKCLARTYRGEECVCDTDEGDAEDYDEVLTRLQP